MRYVRHMRCVLHERYGPPSVLRIADMPSPTPGPHEILVAVRCSTVNRTDCGFLRAKPFVTRFFSGLRRPRHSSLGCEFAGEVAAVGERVTKFAVGDAVFGFDDHDWGGHAELKLIGEDKAVAKVPVGISFAHAAASTEGAHYALVYIRAMSIGREHRVLVHGATGAIGSAAVQLLKHAGAHVVATSNTSNVALVTSLGPDHVIDHEKVDFTQYGERFDVVFDAVGKSSFGACKPLLDKRGVYVSTELGPRAENPFLGLVSPLYKLVGARRVLFPLPSSTQEMIEFLRDRLAAGDFKPVIDRTYPLDDIVAAFEYVESGQKTGNVVLQVS